MKEREKVTKEKLFIYLKKYDARIDWNGKGFDLNECYQVPATIRNNILDYLNDLSNKAKMYNDFYNELLNKEQES